MGLNVAERMDPDKLRASGSYPLLGISLGIDFQTDVNFGAIIKLADSFGAALTVAILRIDFVVRGGLKRREAVGSVWANDIGLHGAGVGIGQVYDCVGQRAVAGVQYLAGEQAGFVFLGIAS